MTTIVTRAGKGSPLTHTEVDTNFTNLNTAKLETAAIPLGTLQAPSVSFLNDSDTGIFCPQGGNSLAIATGAQYAITCTSTQAVGIKTANPQKALHVAGATRVGADDATDAFLEIGEGATGNRSSYIDIVGDTTYTDYGLRVIRNNGGADATSEIKHRGTGAFNIVTQEAAPIQFYTSNSPRVAIDSSGRLLVGTSNSLINGDSVQIATDNTNCLGLLSGRADAFGPRLDFAKSRGTTISPGNVLNDDQLANLLFSGYHGGYVPGAKIEAYVDGTPGANDMPGRLVFSTTADGASSPTERMRIQSTGTVLINKTSSSVTTSGFEYRSSNELVLTSTTTNISINRLSTDGDLIDFFQDTVREGNISVSGTTVSYNGAHLSRWSQLPSGAERTEILRGSVLSNLDEMCEWGEEDNEQLNRMKVSDVEGDKNVSGVFQCWDDDDDTYTNDFYCAMTGDFIIRIAAGVTVERGDLLMSAGDGTAKPQDDDIIRSKTIAKVTSTNVSCTYDDGSYCVPCVLMAC